MKILRGKNYQYNKGGGVSADSGILVSSGDSGKTGSLAIGRLLDLIISPEKKSNRRKDLTKKPSAKNKGPWE